MDTIALREIPLFLAEERKLLETFLAAHDLKIEGDIDCALGLYQEEMLVGCGCAAGALLKCFAISPELRGKNGLGLLVSGLSANRFAAGIYDLQLFTRTHNVSLFSHCGFTLIAQTQQVALLENRKDGVERYLKTLPAAPSGCTDIGAIVMNGNPPTRGHLALIERAASQCEFLYLFVVEEDRSAFPFADRFALLQELAQPFSNVCVCPSGAYMISAQTFPTYFLKEQESPSSLQSELDTAIFAQRIAAPLHITKRFVGKEPFDPVTRTYNDAMRRILPEYGIDFCEMERVCAGEQPISATEVRRLLALPQNAETDVRLAALLPDCTLAYVHARRENGDMRK